MVESMLDRKKFSMMIEERVRDDSLGYIDAILALCEDLNLDSSDVSGLISNIVRDKIEAEAVHLRYMKGGNTLPV